MAILSMNEAEGEREGISRVIIVNSEPPAICSCAFSSEAAVNHTLPR